jgi:hypothetical protein
LEIRPKNLEAAAELLTLPRDVLGVIDAVGAKEPHTIEKQEEMMR